MKLLVGNGRELTVRDVGPVVMRIKARRDGIPLKFNGFELLDDDAARERVRGFLDFGCYDRE